LLLDRDFPLPKLAAAYFDTFTRQLIRTVVANISEVDSSALVGELIDLLAPMTGIIAVREVGSGHVTREFCAYQDVLTVERVTSLLQEQNISELDLLAGAEVSQLPHYADLDSLSTLALNELIDQLRAEELDSSELTTALSNDKGLRKARRRRTSVSHLTDALLSPEEPRKRIKGSTVNAVPIEIITGCGSRFVEQISHPSGIELTDTLTTSIAAKEAKLSEIYTKLSTEMDQYGEACQEYELLSLVYKVLSQPDEVLLRKMNTIEEYEERLKKLGARLQTSLSPEDLLRTLVSIQNPA
jgi:hypothetical protein